MDVRAILQTGLLVTTFLVVAVHCDDICRTSDGIIHCPDDCCGSYDNMYCCNDDDDDDDDEDGSNIGTVIGIFIACLIMMGVMAALVVVWCRNRRNTGTKGAVIHYNSNQNEAVYNAGDNRVMYPYGTQSFDNNGYQGPEVTSQHVVPNDPPPPYSGPSDNVYESLEEGKGARGQTEAHVYNNPATVTTKDMPTETANQSGFSAPPAVMQTPNAPAYTAYDNASS